MEEKYNTLAWTFLNFQPNILVLALDDTYKIHFHVGKTCATVDDIKGHYFGNWVYWNISLLIRALNQRNYKTMKF